MTTLNDRDRRAFDAAMRTAPDPVKVTDTSPPEDTWYIDYTEHDRPIWDVARQQDAELLAEREALLAWLRIKLMAISGWSITMKLPLLETDIEELIARIEGGK